jgi:hypothetical protein
MGFAHGRLAGLAVVVACLALPAGASAQVPGAHYTGTTQQNYPINFDVSADGTTLTNVVTTANASCNGGPAGPGALRQLSTDSKYAFPIAGGAFDGYDENDPPYLKFRGSFAGSNASGTLDAFSGGSYSGGFYQCNALQVPWRASTAGGGGGGDDGGGGGGDDGGGGTATGKPAVTIAFPKGVLWKPSLSNGVVISVGVDQLSSLSGNLVLSKKLAKKYGLGDKAKVIAKAKLKSAGADSALEFKFSKAIRSKLKNAKSLKLTLEVTAKNAAGVTGKGSQVLKFS